MGLLATSGLSAWDAVICQQRGVGPASVILFGLTAVGLAVGAAWVLVNDRS